jgi:hypothetical protein
MAKGNRGPTGGHGKASKSSKAAHGKSNKKSSVSRVRESATPRHILTMRDNEKR